MTTNELHEARERLVAACRAYCAARIVPSISPLGAEIQKAYAAYEAQSTEPQRPKIVCLCGSTRFAKEFADANERETLAGNIVLSVGCFRRLAPDGQREPMEESVKVALDVLHKQKIDLADEVLVLNVGGYIGESTRSEIEHARKTGKRVRYLERGRTPTADPPASPTEVSAADQVKILEGMLEEAKAERDEARAEVASLDTYIRHVLAERDRAVAELRAKLAEHATTISAAQDQMKRDAKTIAELRAKLERPEMSECVREFVEYIKKHDCIRVEHKLGVANRMLIIEAHYPPPFRITGPGVYLAECGREFRILCKDQGLWVGMMGSGQSRVFHDEGVCSEHPYKLTTYLRPLEEG